MTPTPASPLLAPPKLVATDLDGTLLRSDGTLSPRTRTAVAAAEDAGIRVVLVTGRPPRSVPSLLDAIGPHFVIAANGAAVYAPDGTAVRTDPIPAPDAAGLVLRVRSAVPGVSFAFEYDTGFAHEPAYPSWSYGEDAVDLIGAADELLAGSPARPVVKVLAHHPTLPLDVFHHQARHAAGDRAETTHSTGLSLVEFSAPGVTKATTLMAWSGELGIGRDEIAAFGDMPNDLPMLRAVGMSYAMANAHPEVLAAAHHRTSSNDEDGVARQLERFVAVAAPHVDGHVGGVPPLPASALPDRAHRRRW
ncbi:MULTISPECIES: HAD family hydrolase [unclassified Streptomyces]|uniref:HAD family hydrolase n=1 Tax=unclassified Streptomyces TaxID=2593676 RepID=UPI002E793688|nr:MULTISPECIES: Cof-type HAD-IIB family hydrolase [unclassified Streptomyces]MEE1759746.1 Cof-type HAD-IIB family hydrolase [Streptomyces sp. SP18BB07]MEE1829490.1 Cof-type HAD-IIB family hydrolase [Streptomyces sp. SP17KL33]